MSPGRPREVQDRRRPGTHHDRTRRIAHGSWRSLTTLLSDLIAGKRERPADDLLTALVQVSDER